MTEAPRQPPRIEPLEPERKRPGIGCILVLVCWIIIGGFIWWLT